MTEEEFLALEREGWEAVSSSRGADYYRRHLSEDALMAFPLGVIDRTHAIDVVASAQLWSATRLPAHGLFGAARTRPWSPVA
jgi:hypothetical protein